MAGPHQHIQHCSSINQCSLYLVADKLIVLLELQLYSRHVDVATYEACESETRGEVGISCGGTMCLWVREAQRLRCGRQGNPV